MKKFILLILLAILTISTTALADVKIKARQTMSGQTAENTTYIKGKRSRTEQNMGGMQMISLTQCDLKRSVQLNPQAQVYTVNSWNDDPTTTTTTTVSGNTKTEIKKGGIVTTTVTTKDTGETKKMFGYTARHLIITMETESSPDACSFQPKTKMVTDGWYIDAAFALDCDYQTQAGGYNTYNSGSCQDKYELKQVGATKRGYPVIEKTTMYDANGKETFTMTNEVIELSNATLDAALFDIPQGWREVKDSQSLYTATASNNSNSNGYGSTNQTTANTNTGLGSTISTMNSSNTENTSNTVEPKKEGTVRIGLAGVKTGEIGEGINPNDLAGAIQNALPQYMKGTKVEIVPLEAKLASALDAEAKEKGCDYVLYATVSHKKGGGGFGKMFGKMSEVVSRQAIGSSNVGGQIARTTIVTAASASANVKSKDEISLEIKLQNGSTVALAKQFKQKAKSDGEDIISPVVEQAAQAIVETVGKS